jgi:hypothetical protein
MTNYARSEPVTGSPKVIALASMWLVFHWLAILANVMAARTGPWSGESGFGPPPPFAVELFMAPEPSPQVRRLRPLRDYLAALKLLHNYHFVEDVRSARVRVEARLLDANGAEIATLTLPDPQANAAVRHRQLMLMQGLAEDQLIEPPPGEYIPPPNQPPPTVEYWNIGPERTGVLGRIEQHLIRDVMNRRETDLYAPTPWAMLLSRSYARYLSRKHGAAAVEIFRHTREHISPELLERPPESPEAYSPLKLSFGVIHATAESGR